MRRAPNLGLAIHLSPQGSGFPICTPRGIGQDHIVYFFTKELALAKGQPRASKGGWGMAGGSSHKPRFP